MDDDLPRPLTRLERDVLNVMLSAEFVGVEALRAHSRVAVVTGMCGCGCPTIYLRPGDTSEGLVLVSEAVLNDDRGQTVLLFANTEGELEALELEWTSPSPPNGFPEPDDLQVSPG